MHYVDKITIENFRSIVSASFPLAPYTALVGCNNAGKTNVIKALSWMAKKTSLTLEDFHDASLPVNISCSVRGVDEAVLALLGRDHRNRIEEFIQNERLLFRRTQDMPDQSVSKIYLEILNGEGEWVKTPTGIDAAIACLLPEPIYIGAMQDAAEDVSKYGSSTTIGKLLREILAPVSERYGAAVTEALGEIRNAISAEGDNKDESLRELDGQIERELRSIFSGVSAKIDIATPQFEDFIKSATIKLFEDDYRRPGGRDVRSMGHGAQRSTQIAIIKCLADRRRAGEEGRTTLLLIDEPELYLHPYAIEMVRASLRKLSISGYQVVFSTHSPIMISRADAANVLLIRRTADEGTYSLPTLGETIEKELENAETQAELLFALGNSSQVLFSSKVVATEGKTERALLPHIAKYHIGGDLGEQWIGLVSVGSSSGILSAIRVLKALGVPCKAIADLDFAFKICRFRGLLNDQQAAIQACLNAFKKLEEDQEISLGEDGMPRGGRCPPEIAFEKMAKLVPDEIARISEGLLAHNIWVWPKGAIEAHLGMGDKKPATHAKFVSDYEAEEFRERIPDPVGVASMFTWIAS